MSIFNKVTLQFLRKNRTKTIVTIVGIILSTSLICAVTTSVGSLMNYLQQYTVYTEGAWHAMAENVDDQVLKKISAGEEVKNAAYAQLKGYAKVESTNEAKPYLYVMGAENQDFFDMMSIHLTEGNFPVNSEEIIIPEHLATKGGLQYELGDTIELELGDRVWNENILGQSDSYYSYDAELGAEVANAEKIEVNEVRTYTVVGFYERLSFNVEGYTAPGFTAFTVSDENFSDEAKFDVYFKMKNASDVYSFAEDMGIESKFNTELLLYSGASQIDGFMAMLSGLIAIISGLIVFASISLIYNAFSISISERTRQFGLLSSLGATKKQLRKMVLFEAVVVSIIGIPIGIIVGILGIGITLFIVGNKFISLIGGGFDVPMRICVSWEAVAIAVVGAFITVLISVWIPSKRATKVTAVEAIRRTHDIKEPIKPVKVSKLTYRLMGLPGVLASKHYKRDKRKYRTTVVSLFMSIVLFVSASAFSKYLMEAVTGGMSKNEYDLEYYVDNDELNSKNSTIDEVEKILSGDEHITNNVYVCGGYFAGYIKEKYLSTQFIESRLEYMDDESDTDVGVGGILYFIDDEEFIVLLDNYRLNKEEYFNKEKPLGIAIDHCNSYDAVRQKYVSIDALKGDECEILCTETYEVDGNEKTINYSLRTGKTIKEKPFYISKDTTSNIIVVYPESMKDYVLPLDQGVRQYFWQSFYLTSDNYQKSFENLEKSLSENGFDETMLINYAEQVEQSRNIVTIIKVFAYGFIVLISLIAAANVFNTISTNINLRRREFAMLKSVGMTASGFRKMMNYECLLYGFRSLLYGLPASAGVSYLIYLVVMEGYETNFQMPWTAMGIASVCVFAVVFITMLYSMKKLNGDNPIDILKDENL